MPIPWRILFISSGPACTTLLPSTRMSPLSGRTRPRMSRSIVLLPMPEGPSTIFVVPRVTRNVTSARIWRPPML